MSIFPSPPWRIARWSWPAEFPIVQFPNPPLLVALAASLAANLTGGQAHRLCSALFYLSLSAWAYEEARRGENWFRRLLGVGFAAYILVSLASSLQRS